MNWQPFDVRGDVTLRAWRTGTDGAPPVVLAHGFSDDGRCWGRFAERVADRFDLLAVDARNHGGSGRGPASPELLASDLATVIDAATASFGWGRPALVGHSLGATTVAGVAATRPDLAGRMVLEDPPWRVVDTPIDDARRAALDAWMASLADSDDAELHRLGREWHPVWPDAEFDSWVAAKHLLGPRAVEHMAPFDWRATMALVTCPVLVVLGEPALGAIATGELVDEIVTAGPTVERTVLHGAGHNIRRERLDDFTSTVAGFLDREV